MTAAYSVDTRRFSLDSHGLLTLKPNRTERRLAPKWIALVAVLAPAFGIASAFDAPDTGVELFARDGIFLPEDERSSLLEALAAIASNFPASSLVDDDLREKALAVALGLDPLHYHSRAALRELVKGTMPQQTPFFDSLPAISENLWSVGNRLSQAPVDPEEKRLAVRLLELSLVTHPDPPADRLAAYARICGDEAPDWKEAVKLHRESNPSTARASSLFRRALNRVEHEAEKADAKMDPERVEEKPSPLPAFEPVTRSLWTVRRSRYDFGSAISGTLSLTLRSPTGASERRWLVELTQEGITLPLYASASDIPLTGPEISVWVAEKRNWDWPVGVLAGANFTTDQVLPGPLEQMLITDVTLPAFILLDAVFTRREVNPEFILTGEAQPLVGASHLDNRIFRDFAAALGTSAKYVLVPETAYGRILEQVKKDGSLDQFFKKEFISYSDAVQASDRMLSATGEDLLAASAIFAEIAGASQRMPLPELARNPSAQDRLRALIAACPSHLSARVMLDYGLTPPSEGDAIGMFARKLHAIVEPLLSLEESTVSTSDAGDSIGTAFLKLRGECPPAARNLLDAAEDVHEAAGVYLQFTNTSSSMAAQRLRETREAIAKYRAERSKFGLGDPE